MTVSDTTVAQFVRQLDSIYEAHCASRGVPSKSIRAPGASEKAIKAFESEVGIRLPPSYREFIQLNNGWKGCAGTMVFFSLAEQMQFAKRARERMPGVDQPHLIGVQGGKVMICLDRGTQDANGEMGLTLVLNEDGEVDKVPGFTAFLGNQVLSLNMLAVSAGATAGAAAKPRARTAKRR